MNDNLKRVIDNIYAEKDRLTNRINSETNEFVKHDLEFELNTVTDEKLSHIYIELINNMPEGKDNEIKKVILNVFESQDNYDRFVKNVKTHIPKATFKDICLGVPTVSVVKNFDTLVDGLTQLIDDKTMNKIAKSIESYVPGSINNTPVYPYAKKIEEIKKSKKFDNLTQAEKEIVAKQLDEINNVVKESPRRYSEVQTNFDTDYERIINAQNNEMFKNLVKEDKEFAKAFEYRDLTFSIKDDVAGDPEKVAIAQSPSFKLTRETQNSVLTVWKKMDELDIITAGDGAESGSKIYGFAKLHKARKKLDEALEKEEFGDLKQLKEEYEKQVQNVRDMYALIKTELNPTPDKIPGNVQNYREDFVPAEFKNDISTNATFNAMYNTYSIVKSLGLTPEEFLSNPQQYIDRLFNSEITKFHIDKYYSGVPFEETLASVYSDKSKPGLNTHGVSRMVSTLMLFEKDPQQKKQDLIFATNQSGKLATIYEDQEVCYNYFTKERTNTFINLLFVNPEDRNFNNLRSYDSVTGDKLHKTKAFDLASYLKEKDIPASTIYQRIMSYVSSAYNLSVNGEKEYKKEQKRYDKLLEEYKKGNIKTVPEMPNSKTMSAEEFVRSIKDAQQGIMDYIMLSNRARDPEIEKLEGILKNPAEAFKSLNMDESYVEKLKALNNKDVLLANNIQQAKTESTLNIKDIRTKENTYNKLAEKILKEANKLSAKVANESNDKKVEELQKQSVAKMNELKQLQKAETERLEKEFKAGNIPSDYYKQRVENIVTLQHNDKVAIFDDGLDKDKYIKSTGLEQLTKNEINKLYENEIEKQKTEKEIFINQQFLQNHNLISTNREAEVQKANFEQIDISQIDSTNLNNQREPLVVEEAKIVDTNEKTEPQKEIDPKQTVKMP